jgi:hypothetical protein
MSCCDAEAEKLLASTSDRAPSGLLDFAAKRREIKYRLIYWASAYPVFMPIGRVKFGHLDDLFVTRDTDLVIEGFGRSGTTFANFAFLSAQTRPVKTVHHTHAAAQVINAARMGIPTLLLVRPPLEAALSHMVRHQVPARPPLIAWIRFHRRVLPYLDRIVVTSFVEMITDFGAVTRRINQKFGTSFDVFNHTKENEAAVFERIRRRNLVRWPEGTRKTALAIPNAEREAHKERLRAELMTEELAPLRERAQMLHEAILGSTALELAITKAGSK